MRLLVRRYLPRAGLRLVAHHLYPRHGYRVTRARYAWICRTLATVLRGHALVGDCRVLVLAPEAEA
jgi:hypothetical protein